MPGLTAPKPALKPAPRPAPVARPAPAARVAPPRAAVPPPRPAAAVARPAVRTPAPAAPAKMLPKAAPAAQVAQQMSKSEMFYDLGIKFFTMQLSGAKPAAATPPTMAAPKAAVSAPARVAPRAPAAVAAAPAAGEDELTTLTRAQLVELAGQYGVEAVGQKADDLRTALRAAMAGGAPAAAEEAAPEVEGEAEVSTLTPLGEAQAGILMKLIEDNMDRYADTIDPNSANPSALRCGGDCLRCPNPEGHASADDQIAACFTAIHGDLGMEEPAFE